MLDYKEQNCVEYQEHTNISTLPHMESTIEVSPIKATYIGGQNSEDRYKYQATLSPRATISIFLLSYILMYLC
jgi:hypothetical protein